MNTCGIDFGTSNSTMSFKNEHGVVRLVNLGKNKPETRTVLFWDNEENQVAIGDEGIQRFIDTHIGHLLQAPKSFLNSKDEIETVFGGRVRGLGDIITPIIADFRDKFGLTTGLEAEYVRMGRPVRFHDTDDGLDRKAQERLEKYAMDAGFKGVEFELEPVAAAKTFENPETLEGKLLLVAAFGGGTSDFSIVGYADDGSNTRVLANDGVHLTGNSFDEQLSLRYFSQFLGNGTKFKSEDKLLDLPTQPYFLLSDWKLIHQLNDRKVKQGIFDIRGALDQDAIDRLIQITNNPELGYEYFRMVEKAKIVSSTQDPVIGNVDFFRKAFDYVLTGVDFKNITYEQVEKIRMTLRNSLKLAGVEPEKIGKILLVGGTGQLKVIQEMLEQEIGHGKILQGDTFNAIGKGLSIG